MDATRLSELTARFGQCKVAVVGDFFLDKYLDFDPELAEVSVETGKTANQVARVRHSPGAAGTVVSNLAALGAARLLAVGFVGEDGEGWELLRDLDSLGCDTSRMLVLPDRATPTYLKPQNLRVPGLGGEAERYDTKNRAPLPRAVEERLAECLADAAGEVDADFCSESADGHGVAASSSRSTPSRRHL